MPPPRSLPSAAITRPMRDLAAATAMTAGAIYFHVASKQTLLLAVYEEGVQRMLDRVEAAVPANASRGRGWKRPSVAHLESILDASAYARVLIRILPSDAPEIAAELKELRDRYEARLTAISPRSHCRASATRR